MLDVSFALLAFTSLFAILDPIGMLPMYLGLFPGADPAVAKRVARVAAAAVATALLVFLFAGETILGLLGISLPAFRCSGGILLLLMALEMLRGSPSHVKRSPEEKATAPDPVPESSLAIVPLAIPILAGPGAISAVILLGHKAAAWEQRAGVVLAIFACAIAIYAILRAARTVERLLGPSGIRVTTRVMGLLLAALAVQFMADGLRALFPGLAA